MGSARYVLLGLAPARSSWFREVAQWTNSSMISAEFVKCVSAEEVRARLASGRSFSAFLVDSSVPALDRDLIEAVQQVGCAAIVVGDRRGARDWVTVGANASLSPGFDRKELVETLLAHSVMIGRADRTVGATEEAPATWRAPLAAVCGPGGTGASTVAIALAQGLAADVRSAGSVLLADFVLHAEQAMLHDAREVIPGVQELVELFRTGRPSGDEVRRLAFDVRERDYALLLGLRRARAWATIRPKAFDAALEGLRQAYRVVVADVDPDLEGEDEGGSMDVEERHTMSRVTLASADAVLVVGSPTMKGMHSAMRVITDLLSFGIPGERILPVLNRVPRSARARSQLGSTLVGLLPEWAGAGMPSPLFLPDRRIDEALRDGVRLPELLATPVAQAFTTVTSLADESARRPTDPQRVVPGTVGSWAADVHPDEAANG